MLKNVFFDKSVNCVALEFDDFGTMFDCAYVDDDKKYFDFAVFDVYQLLNNEIYLKNVIEIIPDFYDCDMLEFAAECVVNYKYIVEVYGHWAEPISTNDELIKYINEYKCFVW